MDGIVDILIKVLSAVDGWAIVVIFFLYISYRVFDSWQSGSALRILQETIESLLNRIEPNLITLNSKVEQLLSRFEK